MYRALSHRWRCRGLIACFRRPGTAFGDEQRVGPRAVGAKLKCRQRRLIGRFDQRRRRAIAKNRPQAAVGRVDVFGIGLGREQQHAPGGAAANQPVGQRQAIDKARAAEVEIERPDVGPQAQPALQQAGRRRQRIVGRLRAEQHEVDRPRIDVVIVEQPLGGRRRPGRWHIRPRRRCGGRRCPFSRRSGPGPSSGTPP